MSKLVTGLAVLDAALGVAVYWSLYRGTKIQPETRWRAIALAAIHVGVTFVFGFLAYVGVRSGSVKLDAVFTGPAGVFYALLSLLIIVSRPRPQHFLD